MTTPVQTTDPYTYLLGCLLVATILAIPITLAAGSLFLAAHLASQGLP